jgi:hypothetical protein
MTVEPKSGFKNAPISGPRSGVNCKRRLGGAPLGENVSGANSHNTTVFTDVLCENSFVIGAKSIPAIWAVRHGGKAIVRLILKIPKVTSPQRIELRT